MTYQIQEHSFNRAKQIGVQIKPSTNPKKKIDIYKDGKFIYSIGDINYGDYPTFVRLKGLSFANEKQRLYKLRHQKNRIILHSKGWFTDNILW